MVTVCDHAEVVAALHDVEGFTVLRDGLCLRCGGGCRGFLCGGGCRGLRFRLLFRDGLADCVLGVRRNHDDLTDSERSLLVEAVDFGEAGHGNAVDHADSPQRVALHDLVFHGAFGDVAVRSRLLFDGLKLGSVDLLSGGAALLNGGAALLSGGAALLLSCL